MPDVAPLLKLRRDQELKAAVARNLGRTIDIRPGLSGRYDEHHLREAVVGPNPGARGRILERLPEIGPGNENGQSLNLLCAEVMEFCPVPLKHWQQWAKGHLEDHRTQWLGELARVLEELKEARMFAIPFGRFSNAGENPEQWVSHLQTVNLAPEEAFENWIETGNNTYTAAEIWYFTRPYIMWPMESPGAPRYVTHLKGKTIHIERPSLNQIAPQMPDAVAAITEALRHQNSNRGQS